MPREESIRTRCLFFVVGFEAGSPLVGASFLEGFDRDLYTAAIVARSWRIGYVECWKLQVKALGQGIRVSFDTNGNLSSGLRFRLDKAASPKAYYTCLC